MIGTKNSAATLPLRWFRSIGWMSSRSIDAVSRYSRPSLQPSKRRDGGWRSEPMFDPVGVLGKQRNDKVERCDFLADALDVRLLL